MHIASDIPNTLLVKTILKYLPKNTHTHAPPPSSLPPFLSYPFPPSSSLPRRLRSDGFGRVLQLPRY